MDFEELIEKRHSVRKYSSEPVSKEIIEKLIKAAELTPSSRNKKPCSYIAVTDREILAKLSEAKAGGSQMLKDASAAIVVCGDSEKSDVWIEDCSIAMTYLHLEAVNLGLGSCWIQLRNRTTSGGMDSVKYVKGLLGLDDKLEVPALLSIGNLQQD